MQLFYAPDIVPPYHILPEEESRHCVRVLRMQPGDELHLTDGRGSMYTCRVVEADARRCSVEVVDCIREFEKMPYRLTMAVAPTKNIDRFEWFLEKATEVGVTEIYPLLCEHSERRTIKPEREQRVITSAVKQSLKAYHPVLHDMMPLRRLIASGFDGRRFIAHCDRSLGERPYLGDVVEKGENALILIGPEGDFSREEITFALANGFEPISLGHQRLRTETAALAATMMLSMLNSLHIK